MIDINKGLCDRVIRTVLGFVLAYVDRNRKRLVTLLDLKERARMLRQQRSRSNTSERIVA